MGHHSMSHAITCPRRHSNLIRTGFDSCSDSSRIKVQCTIFVSFRFSHAFPFRCRMWIEEYALALDTVHYFIEFQKKFSILISPAGHFHHTDRARNIFPPANSSKCICKCKCQATDLCIFAQFAFTVRISIVPRAALRARYARASCCVWLGNRLPLPFLLFISLL